MHLEPGTNNVLCTRQVAKQPEQASSPLHGDATLPAEEYVTLDLRLMNWDFMNFKLRVPTESYVFAVKQKLCERHGRIRDLVLCKHSYAEKNELTDDMKTLKEYGILGAPKRSEPEVVVPVFYEFKCDQSDPLLLHLVSE